MYSLDTIFRCMFMSEFIILFCPDIQCGSLTRVIRNPGAMGFNPHMPFRGVLPTNVACPGKYVNFRLAEVQHDSNAEPYHIYVCCGL